MREKVASAILGSIFVLVSLPGSATAPLAHAGSLTKGQTERFTNSLAVASNKKMAEAPVKVVGSDGSESLGVKTTAQRVYIVDVNSDATLREVNADAQGPIASITKLMTALVLRAHDLEWDKKITITKLYDDGGMPYFAPGDTVTVRQLWTAMLVGSSNTAAVVLANSTGLGTGDFLKEMNATAAGLGMAKTHFVDMTGLSQESVSTARDVSLLARAAFSDAEIATTTHIASFQLQKVKGKNVTVASTDRLLSSFINQGDYKIIGGKTGFINESGYNIVVQVTKAGSGPITVVLLGSASTDLRFQEAKAQAYWTYQNYRWPQPAVAATVR